MLDHWNAARRFNIARFSLSFNTCAFSFLVRCLSNSWRQIRFLLIRCALKCLEIKKRINMVNASVSLLSLRQMNAYIIQIWHQNGMRTQEFSTSSTLYEFIYRTCGAFVPLCPGDTQTHLHNQMQQ